MLRAVAKAPRRCYAALTSRRAGPQPCTPATPLARASSSTSSPATPGAAPGTGPEPTDGPGTTHFGFQSVAENDKERMVGDVFKRVASTYDLMNDLMSGTMHRLWKDDFVRMLEPLVSSGDQQTVVLDVAGGTGDIAFRIVDSLRRSLVRPAHPPHVIVCDINPSMLSVGRDRARSLGYLGSSDPESPGMTFVEGNAERLPIATASVDAVTIAFGIRNVTHVDAALAEAHRVLKPGGRFMCLEFSAVTNPVLRQAYDAYSFAAIPLLGELVARDRASYQYLVESIRRFPSQEAFAGMLRDAGFAGVTYTNFTFGVCAVHSGFKLPHVAGAAGSSSRGDARPDSEAQGAPAAAAGGDAQRQAQ